MRRQQLQALSREELIVEAERAGVPRPRVLTQAELIDEILKRTAGSERERARSRGWLGRARDLLATVVEKGLHLPDAAAAIRSGSKGWPPPPPPLPTVTLAEIYAAQGHLERAVAVLDEVLRREPDHQEARELRERFLAQLARGPKSVPDPPVSSAADTEPSPTQAKSEEASADATADPKEAPPSVEVVSPQEEPVDESAASRERVTLPSSPPASNPADRHQTAPTMRIEGTSASPVVPSSTLDRANPEAAAAPLSDPPEGSKETKGAADDVEEAAVEASAEEPPAEGAAEEEAPSAAELAAPEEAAAATEASVEELEGPLLPERYDVDEVVALAVDPSTFYVYWEVRPTTFAHMAARAPHGSLALRVTAVTPGWDGPIVETRDVAIDALHGDHFIHHVRPRADVRVSVGWIAEGRFDPIAIGAEVSAPRAFVAAGAPTPQGAPLDLSEGPHGAPPGFVRPVVFDPPSHSAAWIAAGWVPREIPGTTIEGAPAQAPATAGAGPTEWLWVPGPVSEQIGMSIMIGPSTIEAPRAPSTAAPPRSRERASGRWGGASESGPWETPGESGPWGGASESGPWGGASDALHR